MSEATASTMLSLAPISQKAMEPFGAVIEAPSVAGERSVYTRWLETTGAGMTLRLHINRLNPTVPPYEIATLERHPYSPQIFLPLDLKGYVVVVAPALEDGRPDVSRAQAFLVPSHVGIVYRAGVWHAGATVLDGPGAFAVIMGRNDSSDDEEFIDLHATLQIRE